MCLENKMFDWKETNYEWWQHHLLWTVCHSHTRSEGWEEEFTWLIWCFKTKLILTSCTPSRIFKTLKESYIRQKNYNALFNWAKKKNTVQCCAKNWNSDARLTFINENICFKKSIYSCIVTDVKQQKINVTNLKLSELVTAAPLEHILSKRKKYDFIKQNESFWRTKTYGEHLALGCDCFTWQKPLRWTLKLLKIV